MKVKDFWPMYWTQSVMPNDKESHRDDKKWIYTKSLAPFFGNIELKDIDDEHILEFIGICTASGKGNKTIRNHLTVLRDMMKFAVRRKRTSGLTHVFDFTSPKPVEQRVGFLTYEQFDRLHMCIDIKLYQDMAMFNVNTGLRLGELCGLQWENVREIGGELVIDVVHATARRKKTVGTPKSYFRTVPLNVAARDVIQQLDRCSKFVFAFPGQPFGPLSTKPLHAAMIRARIRAGLTEKVGARSVSWHLLRHTFASRLAIKGASLRKIKDLLGHVAYSTTLKYAHLSPSSLSDAVKLLDD